MKKLYTLISFFSIAVLANASQITIAVSNSQFSPANVTAQCGDTITWAWASGSHTTTSTTIPGCATSWNANLNSSNLTYSITVPCAGTYNYKCTPHGFTGVLNVTCPTVVPLISNTYFSSAYPNPFTSSVTVENFPADMICMYNAVGEKIKSIPLNGKTKTDINTADLSSGIYFYCIIKEGVIIETRKIVKD